MEYQRWAQDRVNKLIEAGRRIPENIFEDAFPNPYDSKNEEEIMDYYDEECRREVDIYQWLRKYNKDKPK